MFSIFIPSTWGWIGFYTDKKKSIICWRVTTNWFDGFSNRHKFLL